MKNSIKREQRQAGLHFAERENQRSLARGKSNSRATLKKKILFMIALLCAIVQGMKAQSGIYCTASDVGRVICTDGSIYDNVSAATAAGRTAAAKIIWVDEQNKKGLALSLQDDGRTSDIGTANSTCNGKNNSLPVNGATWKLASKDEWDKMIAGNPGALRDGFSSVGGQNMKSEVYYSSTNYEYSSAYMYAYDFGENRWETDKNGILSVICNVRACLEFNLLELYTIESESGWNNFCIAVNLGHTFSDKYVKLTSNISVSTIAGVDDDISFQGMFDGDGKTITFTKGTSGSPFAEEYCAPFLHVKNATIKNLHVDGTIYTSAKKAAGIVGESHGALTLTGCISSVNINSSIKGDGTHGGLVSTLSGENNTIIIEGCVFDGSFATTNGTINCGGFIGWGVYNKPTIKNSLMKPSSVSAGMLGNAFARWYTGYEPTIDGCYYVAVSNLPTNQGAEVTVYDIAPANLGSLVKDYGMVTVYKNGIAFDGKFYSAATTLSGTGTEDDPYIISTAGAWDEFAQTVSAGTNNFSGQYVRLAQSISVSEMAGSSEANSFQGTFLGNGQTLTFTKGSAGTPFGEEYCAPFRYTNGATITNLKVAGDIYTAQKFAAGLIARPNGTMTITNCQVSTVIHSSVSGDGTHGGFTAFPQGNVNFSGCVYNGRMFTTNGTTQCGGFVGWHNAKTFSFTNSLYAPSPSITAAANEVAITTDCATFVRGGTVSTGCYYTETLGDAQGTLAYTSVPANDITKPFTAADGNNYYVACIVSGVKGQYFYTGSPITVTPTVAFNGETLTEGTDYDYAISPATVQEKGDYTLTITAKGDYTGTKAILFTVTDGTPVTSDMTTLTEGVYAVNQDVTISSRITISGDVILNLGNGATLTASKGIELSQSNTLTINGPGALIINDCDQNKSGIGAASVGTLTINGGTINVTGGQYGAGFGGDVHNTSGGTITINGGIINVTGGQYGAGIGGGYDDQYGQHTFCGNIYINGGQVTVTAGEKACGIGPGYAKGIIDMGNGYSYSDKGYSSGSLTLSWTSVYNDFVNINRLNEDNGGKISSITIADGKQFVIGETTIDSNTTDLINTLNGKTVWPYGQGGDYVLTDGNTYIRTGSIPVTSATYTKTTDRVGKYHPWLVPFDYTIKAADLEKFKFYKINMIANSPRPEDEATGDVWMFVKTMAAGDVLHANMPYVYMPLEAVTDYEFTTNNAVLKAKNTDVIAKTETLEDIYSFYATYENTKATEADPFYYMSANGGISLGRTATVGAFRWIIRQTSKYGGTPAYARQMTIFDVDSGEVTGIVSTTDFTDSTNSDAWYDMQGRRLQGKPSRAGVYINKGVKVVVK